MTVLEKRQLETRIAAALDKHRFGTLATVENDKPKTRYMAVFHDGLHIYMATDRKTHKVEELQRNDHISVLLGCDGEAAAEIVEIEGTAEITKDDSLRAKLWNDELGKWFKGADDPDYVVLAITPQRIQYSDRDVKQQVWER